MPSAPGAAAAREAAGEGIVQHAAAVLRKLGDPLRPWWLVAGSIRAVQLSMALAVALTASACDGGADPGTGDGDRAASAMAVTIAQPQTRELARAITVAGPVAAVEEMQL